MELDKLNQFIQNELEAMKATDICKLDVSKRSTITEVMFIVTGNSSRHVKAIANNLVKEAKQLGIPLLGWEGEQGSNWVLVDLGDAIVHVMLAETRDLYALEKLWGEEPIAEEFDHKKVS